MDFLSHVDPAACRQGDVQQQQVRVAVEGRVQAAQRVVGQYRLITEGVEADGECFRDVFIIFDDENYFRRQWVGLGMIQGGGLPGHRLVQRVARRGEQFFRVVGFFEEAGDPHFHRTLAQVRVFARRDENDRSVLGFRLVLESFGEVETVSVRQPDIKDDQIGPGLPRQIRPQSGIRGHCCLVPVRLESDFQRTRDLWVVFNDEDLFHS